jgi:hypothetical protein
MRDTRGLYDFGLRERSNMCSQQIVRHLALTRFDLTTVASLL